MHCLEECYITPGPNPGKAEPVLTRQGQETLDRPAATRLTSGSWTNLHFRRRRWGAVLALTPEGYFRLGAYDVRDDPSKKKPKKPLGVKPREIPERPLWHRLTGRDGAGPGATHARRGLRWPRRLSGRGRHRQVRAGGGAGAGAGQGRGARAALAAGRCEGLGAVPRAAPGLVSLGCRRGRAPSACQSPGPSASRLPQPAHRERSRQPRARTAPALGPPSRPLRTQRARLARTKLPVHSDGQLCPSRCVPVADATFSGAGSLLGPEVWGRAVEGEMLGGSGAAAGAEVRCCRPSGLGAEPARSPAPLQLGMRFGRSHLWIWLRY